MTDKNLITTLDEGLIRTCLLPDFSALLIAFKASAKTEVLVILNYVKMSVIKMDRIGKKKNVSITRL
jgi:hypothetical protein